MRLLIDDQRILDVDIIARTSSAGTLVLQFGYVTHLYLDFDLGGEKTGLDVIKNMNPLLLPPVITLVTQNPVGLKQMTEWLKDNGYVPVSTFSKEFRRNGKG